MCLLILIYDVFKYVISGLVCVFVRFDWVGIWIVVVVFGIIKMFLFMENFDKLVMFDMIKDDFVELFEVVIVMVGLIEWNIICFKISEVFIGV